MDSTDDEPIILQSAHRHGVTEDTMLHALRYAVTHFVQEDDLTMFIGQDRDGTLSKSALSPGTTGSPSSTS